MESGRKLLERYGLKHSKQLGQHFLFNRRILERIAASALPLSEDGVVIEIGPGPCGLTSTILEICKPNKLYCIEKDVSFKALHNDFAVNYPEKVEFIYGDALDLRLQSLFPNTNFTIIANLPYNVGTKLLTGWLLDSNRIDKMILMFQKEVANRICAAAGTKEYGRLSIISQLLSDIEKLFDISGGEFYPIPKVSSTVIKMVPREYGIPKEHVEMLQKLTTICFQKRRKMIHTILKSQYRESEILQVLRCCSISPKTRPENINPEIFIRLAMAIGNLETK